MLHISYIGSQRMHDWLYTLRRRFNPESEDRWQDYIGFSGFRHISELVTLDSMMCPDIVTTLVDEDWNHNVQEDYRVTLFRSPEYLLARQPLDSSHQLLAILELPSSSASVPPGFERCGFDIMDVYFGNSTLTNCGRIPEAFDPSMVNKWGLLSDYETAIRVRDRMRQLQPDDPHLGSCDVWLVGRALPNDGGLDAAG